MLLTLDFETYYDDNYSLSKVKTLEYVRDKQFKVHCVAVKIDEGETRTLSDSDFRVFLEGIDPSEVELVCQNTYFDGLVLFTHYDFVPKVYRDTLSMSRALLPQLENHDLDTVCKLLRIGEKIPEVLHLTKGLRELSPEIYEKLCAYAINDVELTYLLYHRLRPGMPEDELQLIHYTIKWGACPILEVDLPRAKEALKDAEAERNRRIAASGETLEVLSSQPKFQEACEARGIEIPVKTNSKGKEIPALAKNDLGFQEMLTKYPEHRALFEGRMAAKSTIDVTRIARIISIGKNGTLPMPLKYYGAHTGRWSGADGLNPQNFRRKSELRKSILAPKGYVLLVADLKQIEARMNMWWCHEMHWLEVFRKGIDIYTALASTHFNVPVEQVTESQRFFGKTLELGLGYQMGWKKFRTTAALRGTDLTVEEAYETVMKYRNTHPMIVRMWQNLQNTLPYLYREDCPMEVFPTQHPLSFTHEGILLPNDMRIDYTFLTPHEEGQWTYGVGRKLKFIYGGKMLENIIQALARVVMAQHILEIEALGYWTVSSTHDEILVIVKEALADKAVEEIAAIMRTPPDWAPDLPLDVDIGYAREYSK